MSGHKHGKQQVLRHLLHTLVLGLWMGWMPAWAQSVVFINPGKNNEAYWASASQAMQMAAQSLGMQLEVIYAERDRLAPIEIARSIVQRPAQQQPDYIIFTNDYSVGPSVLRVLDGSGIQAFMAFGGVPESMRESTGRPREKYPFWLGAMEPNAYDAGYATAQKLIAQARARQLQHGPSGKIHMVAIAGDRSTPSSMDRNAGMRQAVADAPDVVLEQEVYGDWRRDKAQQQAQVLYQRYPQVRAVWAGNDLMAFGAMQAWRERGGKPGQDAVFSGINHSQEAFAAYRKGELAALSGGHFFGGAWAMVMLFDHAKGIDFVHEGLELRLPLFMQFDAQRIEQFEKHWSSGQQKLDFKPFSKHYRPKLRRYEFDLAQLLR